MTGATPIGWQIGTVGMGQGYNRIPVGLPGAFLRSFSGIVYGTDGGEPQTDFAVPYLLDPVGHQVTVFYDNIINPRTFSPHMIFRNAYGDHQTCALNDSQIIISVVDDTAGYFLGHTGIGALNSLSVLTHTGNTISMTGPQLTYTGVSFNSEDFLLRVDDTHFIRCQGTTIQYCAVSGNTISVLATSVGISTFCHPVQLLNSSTWVDWDGFNLNAFSFTLGGGTGAHISYTPPFNYEFMGAKTLQGEYLFQDSSIVNSWYGVAFNGTSWSIGGALTRPHPDMVLVGATGLGGEVHEGWTSDGYHFVYPKSGNLYLVTLAQSGTSLSIVADDVLAAEGVHLVAGKPTVHFGDQATKYGVAIADVWADSTVLVPFRL